MTRLDYLTSAQLAITVDELSHFILPFSDHKRVVHSAWDSTYWKT